MCRAFAIVGLVAALALAGAPAAALEDPTRPPRLAPRPDSAEPVARELTAILGHGDERVAVIDGRRLRVGDAIGAETVARIDRTQVELRGSEGPITLTLFGPPVKTPVSARKESR